MSKAKFEAVKELIQTKQYDEARALLKTIDHPTAREWETKLNQLAPQPTKAAAPLIRFGKQSLIIGGAVLGVVVVIILAAILLKRPTATDNSSSNVSGTSQLQVNPNFDRVAATRICKVQVQQWVDENRTQDAERSMNYCVAREECLSNHAWTDADDPDDHCGTFALSVADCMDTYSSADAIEITTCANQDYAKQWCQENSSRPSQRGLNDPICAEIKIKQQS